MRKKGNWLAIKWLDAWKSLTTPSRWQRGKALYDAGRVDRLDMTQGEVSGVTCEQFETYEQKISSRQISADQITSIQSEFIEAPGLVMAVYSNTLNQDRLPEFLRSMLVNPKFSYDCSCDDQQQQSPCKHLIAVAIGVAAEMDKDPAGYMRWLGFPWDETLASLSAPEAIVEREVVYSMTPLPRQTQFQPIRTRQWESPPFWTSPFPFPLIMEEIYSKIKSTAKDDEDRS